MADFSQNRACWYKMIKPICVTPHFNRNLNVCNTSRCRQNISSTFTPPTSCPFSALMCARNWRETMKFSEVHIKIQRKQARTFQDLRYDQTMRRLWEDYDYDYDMAMTITMVIIVAVSYYFLLRITYGKIWTEMTIKDHSIISPSWPQKACEVNQNDLTPFLNISEHYWNDFLRVSRAYGLIRLRYGQTL